ncbi:uncharacterized protein LOC141643187 [Silene latifolia]|uniref:uncharacterized protein LOC141643187 n=1 Tax=Silene latifolia TaxID=37657 RepID=UPI003D772F90
MSAKLIETHRKDAQVYNGPVQCKQKLDELMKEINMPSILFPLVDIQEFGYNKSTGFVWLTLSKPVQHKFTKMKKLVSYDNHVTAFVEPGRLKNVKGVKSKEVLIWFTLSDFYIEDPNSGKVIVANPSGLTFPINISDFEEEDKNAQK